MLRIFKEKREDKIKHAFWRKYKEEREKKIGHKKKGGGNETECGVDKDIMSCGYEIQDTVPSNEPFPCQML
jgi:hypothetical protein